MLLGLSIGTCIPQNSEHEEAGNRKLSFSLVYDRAVFDGSRIANSDSCRLDIARMTGSDRHTLELNAGDTLQVQRSAS